MNSLAKKLNITDPEGWHRVSHNTLQKCGVGGLLASKYNDSPTKLLAAVYPEYPKFPVVIQLQL